MVQPPPRGDEYPLRLSDLASPEALVIPAARIRTNGNSNQLEPERSGSVRRRRAALHAQTALALLVG